MKAGDLVKTKSYIPKIGIIIEDVFPHHDNNGRAWRVLFSDGKIKPTLTKNIEVINGMGS